MEVELTTGDDDCRQCGGGNRRLGEDDEARSAIGPRTMDDWVGKSPALLEPLADAIGRHVLAGQVIFADDTPVKMLPPGTGRTATARLWAYGRSVKLQ